MNTPTSVPLPASVPARTAPRSWSDLPHAPVPGTLLGLREALSDGTPHMQQLDTGHGAEKPFRYLLLRSGERITAFVNRCAHFGVPLAERQDQLKFVAHVSLSCNVHYARYNWDTGLCEWGDCKGESLLPIPVVVDADGRICIAQACAP